MCELCKKSGYIENPKLFSHVKTHYVPEYVQDSKVVFLSKDEEGSKKEIAQFHIEFMRDSSTYLLGPGTTTKKIFDLLGLKKHYLELTQ